MESRSLWLKAGDRNTAYFHKQYRAILSKNHIAKITLANGQMCKGFEQVKVAAEKHFHNLLTAERNGSEEDTNEFLSNIPKLVNSEDNSSLLNLVSEEEIYRIVWSMEPDKAPGPDGFSIHFYKIC